MRLRLDLRQRRGTPGPPVPSSYRLLRLGPVHLEAIKCVALPILVQLSDDHGLHSPKKGCEPGAVVPGPRQHAHRLRGLGLYLGICMLPGLSGRLRSGNADRLATFLEKIKTPVSSQLLPASPAQGTHWTLLKTHHPWAAYPQANGPQLILSAPSLSFSSWK